MSGPDGDVAKLVGAWRAGERPSFFYFWGHRARREEEIGKWCLSQWWPASFVIGDVSYPTAEHFMMARKAHLFGDTEAASTIMTTSDPSKAKQYGRKVRGFDELVWQSRRYELVVEGNMAKFAQNPSLASFLLSVREDVLVEASPVDTIWGIGFSADAPEARDPERWRGLNLLGFALTEVRTRLRARNRGAVQQGVEADEAR